jgi:hypothetical protein
MMSFKQMLMIEPLSDNEPPNSTNEDYEPNAGDKYSQLGDSATVAVLDGIARAIVGVETFLLTDWAPNFVIGLGLFCA